MSKSIGFGKINRPISRATVGSQLIYRGPTKNAPAPKATKVQQTKTRGSK